jgi:tetratricopeptide (TPR) repeat protein
MAKIWQLLDQSFYLINQGRLSEAQMLLEEALRLNPKNMDAWNAYLHICNTRGELENLKTQVKDVWSKKVEDDYLQANQRHILQRVDEKLAGL